MYTLEKWNLSDLVSFKNIDSSFQELESLVSTFEKFEPLFKKTISIPDFKKILELLEHIYVLSSKISAYSYLWYSEDTTNQQAISFKVKVEKILSDLEQRMLFFSLSFKDFDDKNAQRILDAFPQQRYFLSLLLKSKPYTLTKKEETVIKVKDLSGVNALKNIYSVLTTGFTYTLKGKTLTQNELVDFVRSKNPQERIDAYNELFRVYSSNKAVLGEVYKSLISDWQNESLDLRGYKSSLTVRNIGNDIDDNVVEALIKVCDKNKTIFQNYFILKGKKLGFTKMSRYHLYAPIELEDQKVSYDKAVHLVLDTFDAFSVDFANHARTILNNHHVDSEVRPNKYTGAYCYGIEPQSIPYVLLSFTGTQRSVSTLAHELGHGIHDLLAGKQDVFGFFPPLPLAETASIFSETLLIEKLKTLYPEQAQELTFLQLDDLYASIIRQIKFVEFEISAHKLIREHGSVDDLSTLYIKQLKEQFGNSLEVPEQFQYEWLYIPHIFQSPFYCYAYAFGNLLSLALYHLYKEKGETFPVQFLQFLSHGGSKSPKEIVAELGFDISSEEFWQHGFDMIKELVDSLR